MLKIYFDCNQMTDFYTMKTKFKTWCKSGIQDCSLAEHSTSIH